MTNLLKLRPRLGGNGYSLESNQPAGAPYSRPLPDSTPALASALRHDTLVAITTGPGIVRMPPRNCTSTPSLDFKKTLRSRRDLQEKGYIRPHTSVRLPESTRASRAPAGAWDQGASIRSHVQPNGKDRRSGLI